MCLKQIKSSSGYSRFFLVSAHKPSDGKCQCQSCPKPFTLMPQAMKILYDLDQQAKDSRKSDSLTSAT